MRLSPRTTLPGDVWEERRRWLRAVLWAHVAVLALVGAWRGEPLGSVATWVLAVGAFAGLAHAPGLPRQLQSVAVALGLLSASAGFVELCDGATAAWSHPFIVLALLTLYEDAALLVLAVAVVAAGHLLVDRPGEPGMGHVVFIALAGAAGIVTGRLNGRLRDEAREATQRFRSSFDGAPIGMAIVSTKGRLIDVNSAMCEILGHRRETLLGLTLQELSYEPDRDADAQVVRQVVAGDRRSAQRQQRFLHAEGHLVWVNLSLSLVRGTAGSPDHLIAQIEDVTERQRTLEELQHLADHDPLTGLLNRRRLEAELAHQVDLAERYGHRACLVLLDLDDFKSTNDSLGHAVGDLLLQSTAEVLRNRVRRSDLVARIGGDEFAILLPQANREQARRVAEGIAKAIRERVLITAGHEVRTTASLGIATMESGDQPTHVLLRADQALYEVKQRGRDGVAIAPPPLPPLRGHRED
ncbi:MAG TPA: diguanylate cyclase [Solirubrobacteraceae bacterium]|nr:diguanylate cyclase [Solirubrobacteraceae bacterium]